MLKKMLAAAALAAGLAMGVAAPAQASGLDDSVTVVNVADRAGALRGNMGIQMQSQLTTYQATIGTGGRLDGPTSYSGSSYPFYPQAVTAGSGYCVWEQVYSRPTNSTGDHTTYEGERTYGKNESTRKYGLASYAYAVGTRGGYYEDKDYWSTLRMYAC